MFIQTRGCWLVLLLIVCHTTRPAAQAKPFSVGAGYQFLKFEDLSFPLGIDADFIGGLTPHVAVVGDIGWSRDAAQQFGLRDVTTALHVGGGARWTADHTRRFRPFSQLIVGVERDTRAIEQFGSDSVANVFIQPGAGIIVRAIRREDFFARIDVRRVFRENDDANAVALVFGVRLNLR